MHDHAPILAGRVRRHLAERILPAETSTLLSLDIEVAPVTGPDGVEGMGEPIAAREGLALPYRPARVGDAWGPAWGTTWFRLTGQLPSGSPDAAGLEIAFDVFGPLPSPGFQAEGLARLADGTVLKAVNPFNRWLPVVPDAEGRIEVYVEMASNPVLLDVPPFQVTERGDRLTADHELLYRINRADVVVVHEQVRELVADVVALEGLAEVLDETSPRQRLVRRGLDAAMDALDLDDIPGTAAAARAVLAPLLASPADASAHRLSAVGHAHIDSAWLWPLRETRRKVARTLANQLDLLDRDPDHLFVLPAAQHAAWVQQDQPELFERLRRAVDAGRIVPVGGMWVESDANLPGGEAMCRQFLYGNQWFEENLGHRCEEVWLPDSFGYSAGLPQLARLAGARWFLTQKISWNQVDRFPHHSFWWEGLDGTRIFTHFPPADTYNSDLSARELHHAETNFADLGRSNCSLVPFGYGDGGGGPTREMLAQAKRTRDLEGSPRVVIEPPSAFFERAESTHDDPSVWVGELYLELHRATFTTQADVKAGNRRNEHLLRAAELWCATASVRGLMDYPADELRELWREVCLYQFHDILPGSSISWVYRDVNEGHQRISARLRELVAQAQRLLAGEGDQRVRFNAAPVALGGVPALGGGDAPDSTTAPDEQLRPRVELATVDEGIRMANAHLDLRVDDRGLVTSLVHRASGREVVPPGGAANLLQLHQDFPNMWDAWDVDPFYRNTCVDITDVDEVTTGQDDDGAWVRVQRHFGDSSAVQTLRLRPDAEVLDVQVEVDWHERDRFLKLAWPLDVHADDAAFEVQMGHLRRPIHTNTSWDAFRFEVNAHRWVHVGEPDFGVAIANAQTYGWDLSRHARTGGGTFTTVRASLLRGPAYPDPRTDHGSHSFSFTVRPGAGVAEAVSDGYALNLPMTEVLGAHAVEPLVQLGPGAVVEAVKLAEDGSGDVVVRLYEPLGRRCRTTLRASFDIQDAVECDLHERPLVPGGHGVDPSAVLDSPRGADEDTAGVELGLRPFQVATIRLVRGARR